MKKRLPVLLGLLAAAIPAVWCSVVTVEQIPAFIRAAVDGPAESIGLILFRSREAAFAISYPLFLIYCVIFGLLIGFVCRFILRSQTRDA